MFYGASYCHICCKCQKWKHIQSCFPAQPCFPALVTNIELKYVKVVNTCILTLVNIFPTLHIFAKYLLQIIKKCAGPL